MSDENRETGVRRYKMTEMQDQCDNAQSRRDLYTQEPWFIQVFHVWDFCKVFEQGDEMVKCSSASPMVSKHLTKSTRISQCHW